ncbi:MAG TPA: GIY-YIG nuclease family protein [Candidatus Binatia bacterium]|nr:GIY-YIG nuclease family protein [Candidatus Binatia bacterium]
MTDDREEMRREIHPCVYIMTNKGNKVLYTGVTSNLFNRVTRHKDKMVSGFTSRYNVTKLVYYEEYNTMEEAIAREKQIKGGSRQKKIDLVNSKNPEWKDLYETFLA